MSSRSKRVIEAALRKKGFAANQTHHTQMWLVVDGKQSHIHTFLSHGIDEYGDLLLGKLAKQLKLRRAEALNLIDCPMSEADYLKNLREQKAIT